MNPERWQRIQQLFHSALEQEPGRRAEFLQQACAGDESLRSEVEAMLARHAESPDFLESPSWQAEVQALARGLENEGLPAEQGASTAASPNKLPSSHSAPSTRPPWWMYIVAGVFLADCLLQLYCIVLGPNGFDFALRFEGKRQIVAAVLPGSEIERNGLKPGDILLSVNGQTLRQPSDRRVIYANLETGRSYSFDIERDGRRLQVKYAMERVRILENRNKQVLAIWQIDGLLLLATALLIGFCRPQDSLARSGALALATLSISLDYWSELPLGFAVIWRELPLVVGALLWIPTVCSYLVGPIVLTFFALFPRPLFRARWPWPVIWLPALCFVPAFVHNTFLTVYLPLQAYDNHLPDEIHFVAARLSALYYLASLGGLAVNYFRLSDLNDRRRLRVLFVGGAAAVLPGTLRLLIWRFAPLSAIFGWLATGLPGVLLPLIFALFPACFAYSILRHRLLDIRVIIRQGVQYAVTRGALLSIVPLLGVILLLDLLVHGNQPLIKILELRGWVYASLGAAAMAAYSQRRRWGEAIDRRFFREQYDARRLLREVAGEAGRARNFVQAAPGIVARIEAALHPEFAAVMQRASGDAAFRTLASAPGDKAPLAFAGESSFVSVLRILDGPLEVLLGESGWLQKQLPGREIDFLRRARIDLLVPIALAAGSWEALLALGVKRSEEPYTHDDQDLLQAVASNLGLLVERQDAAVRPREEFEECPRCGACYDTGAGRCSQEGVGLTPVYMPRALAGRYRLERRRGRGGMGAVYEATDSALQRRVAVKVIREDRLGSPAAAQRFQREARAAAGFAHPNVVTVYDYGVEAGTRAFLVMELLEGVTLRDELQYRSRLTESRVVHLFQGLCSAVEAAHSRQLIHRDLKPENIFLARAGDAASETVKVLDFGIAKFLPGPQELHNLGETDTGILVGTPGYMSPEQLVGERPAVSWDLWALAVTVYEALTGTLPFPDAGTDKWRESVLAGRYAAIHSHLPGAPDRWEEFFAHSFAADRMKRPQSAAEFLRCLEQSLS